MSSQRLITPLEPDRGDLTVAGVLLHPDEENPSSENTIEIPENQAVVANSLQGLDARLERYGSVVAYESRKRQNSWRKAGVQPSKEMKIERTEQGIEQSNFEEHYSTIRDKAIREGIKLNHVRLRTLNSELDQYGFKLDLVFSDPEEEESIEATQNLEYDLENGQVTSSWSYAGNSDYMQSIQKIVESNSPGKDSSQSAV